MGLLDKIKLDFQPLDTGDPKLLVLIDTSIWGYIENKKAIIEITPPGSEKVRVYTYIKSGSNVFNSSNLLISPSGVYQNLTDGIYRVSLKGSPDSYCVHKDILKTDKTRLKLAELYVDIGFGDDKDTKNRRKKLQDIDALLRGAEYATTIGKLNKGIRNFRQAIKEIDNYIECKTC